MKLAETVTTISSHYGWATVYIAGDIADIRRACREYTLRGLCVSIVPADYVFTGGMESGAAVTLINYARFPTHQNSIDEQAWDLANFLIVACHQQSASVLSPNGSWFLTRRQKEES